MNGRERLVSAAAFAVGAALLGGGAVWTMKPFIRDGNDLIEALSLGPLAMAVVGGAVGWVAGPQLARAPDLLGAAHIGAGVAFASTALFVVLIFGGRFALDALLGRALIGWSLAEAATQFSYIVLYLLVAALFVAPLGALGGIAAWRRIRRDNVPALTPP